MNESNIHSLILALEKAAQAGPSSIESTNPNHQIELKQEVNILKRKSQSIDAKLASHLSLLTRIYARLQSQLAKTEPVLDRGMRNEPTLGVNDHSNNSISIEESIKQQWSQGDENGGVFAFLNGSTKTPSATAATTTTATKTRHIAPEENSNDELVVSLEDGKDSVGGGLFLDASVLDDDLSDDDDDDDLDMDTKSLANGGGLASGVTSGNAVNTPIDLTGDEMAGGPVGGGGGGDAPVIVIDDDEVSQQQQQQRQQTGANFESGIGSSLLNDLGFGATGGSGDLMFGQGLSEFSNMEGVSMDGMGMLDLSSFGLLGGLDFNLLTTTGGANNSISNSGDSSNKKNMGWSATWDESSSSYYYWNSETDETTWDKPVGVEIEGLPEGANETTETSTKDANADYYNSKEYYDWYYSQYSNQKPASSESAAATAAGGPPGADDEKPPGVPSGSYQYASAWNPATGESIDPDFQPDYTLSASFNARNGRFTSLSGPNGTQFDHISKAERQMSHFFDIRQYQEDRNRERQEQKGQQQKKLTRKELEKFKEKAKIKKKERLLKRLGDD
ncbi:hypothetical protein BDR26DRAFT_936448 [Obelidium mucronatum]|nr:hypothetical protein BDR26DRAFT_936448 [Obelidium mucronatum]